MKLAWIVIVAAAVMVLLGDPLIFTKSNIDNYNF